jgi:hypothetical protein
MTTLIILSILIVVTISTRIFQVYKFLKLVSKLCNIYDRNYINEHGDTNISIVLEYIKENYHLTAEWSAYKWMFFKGPSPFSMFFSFEILDIEGQYGKKAVDKLAEYHVFEDFEWEKQNK